MMQLIPLRGPHHHCACWHRDASGNSRLHRVHHPLTRRAAPGRHREPRGTRWASASLVAPRARPGNQPPSLHPVHPRSPETDVRAAASSPVSHAARRRVETPRTWPPRIAVTDRRTLLAWTCATAGQIHAVITNLASSLQAPASAEVFSMVGKSLITSLMNGMPPHIAQLVVGHRDVNTTMGYKAVYPEEVINGHRAFIARRRTIRPGEEYRTPTDEEWEEFLGHFERRKVALGECGRAYSSPCIHEHSCIRCPLLRVEPGQRQRLADIRDNLTARIAEAQREGWLGEAEGLKVSLAAAEAKLVQVDGLVARRREAVSLGMPAFPDIAGRTSTPAKETE